MEGFVQPLRAYEHWLAQYKRVWRGTLGTSLVNPLLYLAALGVGLGTIVDRSQNAPAGVPYLETAADLVRDAHERIDGLGYPNGTRAADVALGARIISVADAFDTMTRPRVFRDAMSAAEAHLELQRCAGTQFDVAVVATFRRVVQF